MKPSIGLWTLMRVTAGAVLVFLGHIYFDAPARMSVATGILAVGLVIWSVIWLGMESDW